jgi:hypothetical protein
MSATDEILANIPLTQLASQLGVDEATAETATRQAIPALLGGLQANAQDPAGAASLAGALGDHPSALVDGGVNLDEVDTADGEKIVGNIFGSNSTQVAHTLSNNLGQQSGLIQKLLPILAPIVLAYISRRLTGTSSGGGAGDLLGSILGGSGGGQAGGGGNVLSDVLGGMLGGGQAGDTDRGSGSVLDMLGGMLGGGRR